MDLAEAVGVVLPGAISAPGVVDVLLDVGLHAGTAQPALVVQFAIAAGEMPAATLLSRLIDVGAGPILHRSPPPRSVCGGGERLGSPRGM